MDAAAAADLQRAPRQLCSRHRHLPQEISAAALESHDITSRLHSLELELPFVADFAPEIFAGLLIGELHGQSLRYRRCALKQYRACNGNESGAVIGIHLEIEIGRASCRARG